MNLAQIMWSSTANTSSAVNNVLVDGGNSTKTVLTVEERSNSLRTQMATRLDAIKSQNNHQKMTQISSHDASSVGLISMKVRRREFALHAAQISFTEDA